MASPVVVPATPEQLRTLGRRVLSIGLLLSATILYIAYSALPPSPLTLPFADAVVGPIRTLMPQRYGFFTRNPREADLSAYKRTSNGRWTKALIGTDSSPLTAFGRESRAQGLELGQLIQLVPARSWGQCTVPLQGCLENAPTIPIDNPAPAPTLCGEVGLIRAVPIPWAWNESDDAILPASRAVVRARCTPK